MAFSMQDIEKLRREMEKPSGSMDRPPENPAASSVPHESGYLAGLASKGGPIGAWAQSEADILNERMRHEDAMFAARKNNPLANLSDYYLSNSIGNLMQVGETAYQAMKADKVQPDSLSSKLISYGQEAKGRVLEGLGDKPFFGNRLGINPKFLGDVAIGMGDSAMTMLAGSAALPLMAAKAGGSRMYELNQQGKGAGEALARGIATGAIEAATERLPLENLRGLASGGGKFLESILKQAGMEGIEEGISYLGNYLADIPFGDAKLDAKELGQSVIGGALSGGVLGGGAALMGNTVGAKPQIAAPDVNAPQDSLQAAKQADYVPFKPDDPGKLGKLANTDPLFADGLRQMDAWLSEDSYQDLIDRYGEMDKDGGFRDTPTPVGIMSGDKVMRHTKTIMDAEVTPEYMIPITQGQITDGKFSYETITDKGAMRQAIDFMAENGLAASMQRYQEIMRSKDRDKNDVVFMQTLYNALANAGQSQNSQAFVYTNEVMRDLIHEAHRAGQTLQASKLMKKMTPDGKAYYLMKEVDTINREKKSGIMIDDGLLDDLRQATDQESMDTAVDAIRQDIANQMPVSTLEKLDAWRMFAMLGNPKTHIRNIAGNAFMYGMRKAANLTNATIESMAEAFGWIAKPERTASFTTRGEDRRFAHEVFKEVEADIRGTKYDDPSSRKAILEKRNILNHGSSSTLLSVLEKARKVNIKALEVEDTVALKTNFVSIMAQTMKARGLTPQQLLTKEGMSQYDEIVAHAATEAKKATFRDDSELAQRLGDIRNLNSKSALANTVARVSMDAIMPFTGTPINIAKRGLEYSPLAIAKSLYDIPKLRGGDMSATAFIRNLSQGLTGTAAAALGFVLANAGYITAGKPEDTKESRLWKLEGKQPYAIKVGSTTYTVDWAVPGIMPVISGVELWKLAQERGFDSRAVFESIVRITDPIVEQSFMQGISNLIQSASYGPGNFVSNAAPDILGGYMGQYIPTIVGQATRTADPVQRDRYFIDPTSEVPGWAQKIVNQQAAKLPIASSTLPAKINQWGEEFTNENALPIRIAENFLSPGFMANETADPATKEIRRLYDVTGDKSIVPNYAPPYVTVAGETVRFSMEQHQAYAKALGQEKHRLSAQLFNTPMYQSMDSSNQVLAVKAISDYASALAKQQVLGVEPDGWVAKSGTVGREGVPIHMQVAIRAAASGSGTDADRVSAIAAGLGLSKAKAQELYNKMYKWRYEKSDFTANQQAQMDWAKGHGISNAVFMRMYNITIGVEGAKGADGKTIPGSKDAALIKAIVAAGYDQADAARYAYALRQ